MHSEDPNVIPLVREELVTGKHAVETGRVRVRTRVVERQQIVREQLSRDEVSVERQAIGRFVETVPPVREEGAITIIPIVEERLFIEKRLYLVEEVRIVRDTRVERVEQPVTLRRQIAEVERVEPTTGDQQ